MIRDVLRTLEHVARENSTSVLTGLGVGGFIATAVLTGRASMQAARAIDEENGGQDWMDWREKVEIVWPFYIPPVVVGLGSTACLIASTRIGNRRAAGLAAAYSISEKAYAEYRQKVAEMYGEKQEHTVRDAVAQDRIDNKPPSNAVVLAANGHLCCELHTMRYFNSDMEMLRKAMNDVNEKVVRDGWVPLAEFYDILDLEFTDQCWEVGWSSDKLMDLEFTTAFGPKKEPCLAFGYRHLVGANG